MKDKTVLITGGTGGIGQQTALALAKLGAHVIVTGRSQHSGAAAVTALRQRSGNPQIEVLLADLSTQAGVRSLAHQFKQQYGQLDVLINNAGVAESHQRVTEDGIEADFAVNVSAPFLLTHLLMDRLQVSPSARVVTLTGGGHPATIDLDNLQAERSFMGLVTYSHTKLIMMAVMYEYAQRVQGTTVTINVCYPGSASTTMTQSQTPQAFPFMLRLVWPLFRMMTRPDGGQSAAKAARSSVYLASSSEVEGVNGTYFNTKSKAVAWPKAVLDPATRQQLWVIVERLTQSESGDRRSAAPST